MKKIILLSFAILASFSSIAQIGASAPWMDGLNDTNRTTPVTFDEIVNAFEAYWADKDETVKGSGYKPFKRWESLYQDYLKPDGTVLSQRELVQLWRDKQQSNKSSLADESDWQSIGPLAHINTGSWSSGQGRINAVTVDPNNANKWYVGAPAGGIWSSEDAGITWQPLSDYLPQIGVSGIAVDPNDSNTIYIATGDDDASDALAVGVLKSTDGGQTWNFTGLNDNNSPSLMNEIFIDPDDSNTLWVATTSGVYKTTNAGADWTNVRSGDIRDLRLKPGDSNVLYAVSSETFYKSVDGGDTWESSATGTPTSTSRLAIDVTPANPEVVYILAADLGNGFEGIYKSTDSGASFSQVASPGSVGDIFESNQAWYDMAFAVSDTDEDEIFTGVLNVWRSQNGGANFTKINNWSSPFDAAYTHADIHNLRFIDGTLFCGSDGGIYTSTNSGESFTDNTEGLAIGQFYRISVASQDSNRIGGGLQDNGGYAYNNNEWQVYYGADGMESAIDPTNPDRVFGFIQFGGGPYYSNNGGGNLSGSYNAPESANWITPLEFSVDGRLYGGYSSLYELDFCSNQWEQVSTSFGTNIDRLEIDPNNPNIIYVAVNNSLRASGNGGETFANLETFGSAITWVEVNNGNSNIIYVTTAGSNGRVYRGTSDGLNYTFEDISGSLPNVPKLVVKHQPLHSQNPLFLGTALGVYRYDDAVGDWELFENNLPNVAVRDLEINVLDGNITAGTYGRGVWQSAIPLDTPDSDIALVNLNVDSNAVVCGDSPVIATVQNNGTNTVSSVSLTYSIYGTTSSFDWTGSIASGETAAIELPSLELPSGSYTLDVTATTTNDAFAVNNSLSTPFNSNLSASMNEVFDFESEDTALIVSGENAGGGNCDDGGSTTLWERGVPSGTLLNQTSSGTQAYATNLTGNYTDLTKEYLVSPCYAPNTMSNPVLSFNMAFDLELNWDLMYVEYSLDQGSNWTILGTADDPNWYNSDRTPQTSGNDCNNCVGAQWTGTNATMSSYSYNLSAFANESSMVFRFVFHSDQSVTEEGVVIDDLVMEGETLSVAEATNQLFAVYPNPSTGIFNISLVNTAETTMELFDITGKLVISEKIPNGQTSHSLDLTRFASGLYVLKATLDGKQVIKKLIVQ